MQKKASLPNQGAISSINTLILAGPAKHTHTHTRYYGVALDGNIFLGPRETHLLL